jgi:hypothetical protein
MSRRGTLVRSMVSILTCALGAAALGTSAAAQTRPLEDGCFAKHVVASVQPQRGAFRFGQGTYETLVGARVYVPAEPGLTQQWLQRELLERASNPRPGTGCPLDVPGIQLAVESAGPGFWVQMASADRKTAREVLRRAQQLMR